MHSFSLVERNKLIVYSFWLFNYRFQVSVCSLLKRTVEIYLQYRHHELKKSLYINYSKYTVKAKSIPNWRNLRRTKALTRIGSCNEHKHSIRVGKHNLFHYVCTWCVYSKYKIITLHEAFTELSLTQKLIVT